MVKKFPDKKPGERRVGRPCTIYYPSKTLLSLKPTEDLGQIVSILATKMRRLCKYEKGGFCKESHRPCQVTNCPHIIK